MGRFARTEVEEAFARFYRAHWPEYGPDWARRAEPPTPSWLARSDLRPITKPRELRELIPRLDRSD